MAKLKYNEQLGGYVVNHHAQQLESAPKFDDRSTWMGDADVYWGGSNFA
jgi:hypothetical protein